MQSTNIHTTQSIGDKKYVSAFNLITDLSYFDNNGVSVEDKNLPTDRRLELVKFTISQFLFDLALDQSYEGIDFSDTYSNMSGFVQRLYEIVKICAHLFNSKISLARYTICTTLMLRFVSSKTTSIKMLMLFAMNLGTDLSFIQKRARAPDKTRGRVKITDQFVVFTQCDVFENNGEFPNLNDIPVWEPPMRKNSLNNVKEAKPKQLTLV